MSIIRGNWYNMEVCDSHRTARAQVVFVLNSGLTLYGCGHCGNKWDRQGILGTTAARYTAPLLEENRAVGAVH